MKTTSDVNSISIVKLFINDPNRESAIIAFGIKPSGKFYHYFEGKMYDEISGSKKFSLGDLKYYSVLVYGKYSNQIIITGGIKNEEYQSKCHMLEFDINDKGKI